jgi:protease I
MAHKTADNMIMKRVKSGRRETSMANRLIGKRIGILLEEGYEDQELSEPVRFLMDEGAIVKLIGSGRSSVFASRNGVARTAEFAASEVRVRDYDAFIVPGGHAPEKMRLADSMVRLIADADELGIVIAAIGRGPQLLISSKVLKDRMATCFATIVIDVKNAGAQYVDEAVVRDGNLITSRGPSDLPMFLDTIADAVGSGNSMRTQMSAGA